MNKTTLIQCAAILLFALPKTYASICPDPNTSSLQFGIVPAPWEVNPFSDNKPQGEANTRFARANILVAGLGRGVMCTYENSRGYYSIWWEISVKIPARSDNAWRNSLAGFECTDSLEECIFYTAK